MTEDLKEFDDEYLEHVGTPHDGSTPHSGRYPFGSGEEPFQHEANTWYLSYRSLKKQGMSKKEIADYFEISTKELDAKVTTAKGQQLAYEVANVGRLKEEGYSVTQICEMLDLTERNAYMRLKEYNDNKSGLTVKIRKSKTVDDAADKLRKELEMKEFIDVGKGVELSFGTPEHPLSAQGLAAAVQKLKDEGYEVYSDIRVPQAANDKKYTTLKILAKPGVTKKEVFENIGDVELVDNYSGIKNTKDITNVGIKYPKSLSLDRVYIRYPDEGGTSRDGTIELRRGVPDISLGASNYAQVRIAVDDTYYLKGVAIYRDDIPDGYDVVFNTSKPRGKPLDKVLKVLKDDPDNPFGATIKQGGQSTYLDENGNEQLSVINKVNEEGDWSEWSKSLSSQFLSKQTIPIIKKQLNLAYSTKEEEFEEIKSLTNPVLKKILLEDFAQDCDASAVHLKAAAVPGQSVRLLLPIDELKDNEVYAPGYNNGDTVILVRYPHQGTYEIPRLTVNNNNKTAQSIIGKNSGDAIGVNIHVAQQLSGADFDGDTVTLLPESDAIKFTARPYLEGLKNFDAREAYPNPEGATPTKEQKGWDKGKQMGIVSNLITDMTLRGAPDDDLVKATKHAMVIIDAEKHNLNWKQSAEDNEIARLKETYQPKADGGSGGASTLVSKSKGIIYVPKRKDFYWAKNQIDPETGKIIVQETGEKKKKKVTDPETGESSWVETNKYVEQKLENMACVDDAFELSSGHPKEIIYAGYANSLKALANEARKEWYHIETTPKDPKAAEEYKDEVESLNKKYYVALKNSPRERQAQIFAKVALDAKIDENPSLTDDDNKAELKRLKGQLLTGARLKVGAKKEPVEFTEREWEAIQNNAISPTRLESLLRNSDTDQMKKLAMPKDKGELSTATLNHIRNMMASGYGTADIADATGLSSSYVSKVIREKIRKEDEGK